REAGYGKRVDVVSGCGGCAGVQPSAATPGSACVRGQPPGSLRPDQHEEAARGGHSAPRDPGRQHHTRRGGYLSPRLEVPVAARVNYGVRGEAHSATYQRLSTCSTLNV